MAAPYLHPRLRVSHVFVVFMVLTTNTWETLSLGRPGKGPP